MSTLLECPSFYDAEIEMDEYVDTERAELVFREADIVGDVYPMRVRVIRDEPEIDESAG